MVNAQKQAQYEMLNFMTQLSKEVSMSTGGIDSGADSGMGMMSDRMGNQPQELRKAKELLSSVAPNTVADMELERLNGLYSSSPQQQDPANMMFSQNRAAPLLPGTLPPDAVDIRHLVYPVGQETGIDPFHSDHIDKIPYTVPAHEQNGGTAERKPMLVDVKPSRPGPNESIWDRKPNILLVEDDKTCSRIGRKFLEQLQCNIEIAVGEARGCYGA
jgi:osomolarity two-component system, response regulator SKN7